MRGADHCPVLHGFDPVVWSRARQVHAAFQTKRVWVATGLLGVLPYAGDDRFALIMQIKQGKPPVSQARNTAHARFWRYRRLRRPRANPDGNGPLDGARIEPGVRDLMPSPA